MAPTGSEGTSARPNFVPNRYLIITADDFGLHEAVNEAVYRAGKIGVLTAASLMVSAPAAEDAVRRAKQLPNLCVGLHLVLADGKSTLPPRLIPALVDRDGCFRDRMFFDAVRYFALPSVRSQLAAEIRAQFEAFARTGLSLDHVNAHKHFHLHPTLLEIIVRIGCEFGMQAVRVPDEPWWFASRAGILRGTAGSVLLKPWIAAMRKRLKAHGIAYNDTVFGIGASGTMDERAIVEILAKLPAGVTEIYLHPAIPASTPITQSMRTYRHADEFAALLSPQVLAARCAAQVVCGGYRNLTCRIAAPA